MKILDREITMNIFSLNLDGELSIGRLYVAMFNKLFSSTVITNLVVDSSKFIQALKDDKFEVEVLGKYRAETHITTPTQKRHAYLPNDELYTCTEHIIFVAPNILCGVFDESFRISYQYGTNQEILDRIIEIYTNLHQI